MRLENMTDKQATFLRKELDRVGIPRSEQFWSRDQKRPIWSCTIPHFNGYQAKAITDMIKAMNQSSVQE